MFQLILVRAGEDVSDEAILTLGVDIPRQLIMIEHLNQTGDKHTEELDCPFNNGTLLRLSQINEKVWFVDSSLVFLLIVYFFRLTNR